ncbi:MAG: LysM peptidoglycan-binding domain-containing protein [Hyphomicrobiales bacterium]|nr:LysM peptidoglycan-binding domain-containing protein [Hyphomicrobiales bacterium]
MEKNAWIIGGSALASLAAVAGLVYHLFTRNVQITSPAKPVAASSDGMKSAAAPDKAVSSAATSEAAKSQAAKPQAAKSDAAKSGAGDRKEIARTEPAKSETAKSETAKSEVSKTEASKTESAKTRAATAGSGASAAGKDMASKAADRRVPSFDIVRVEPSGESVIAGRSEPGADVELLNKGKPFARAKADANGQFVIIPQGLKPGAHQLQLRSRLRDQTRESAQAVAVSVPERGKKDVIVALAAPGKPTVILSDPKPASSAASDKPASSAAAGAPPGGAAAGPKSSVDGATVVAAADPAKAGPDAKTTPGAPQVPVRIRIVEAEQKGGFFVSGFAAPGSRVRLYLNRAYVAEVQTGKEGNWSLRVARGMSPGDYQVRADIVEPSTGKVLSRAQVPFDYPARVAAARAAAPVADKAAASGNSEAQKAAAGGTPSASSGANGSSTNSSTGVKAPAAAAQKPSARDASNAQMAGSQSAGTLSERSQSERSQSAKLQSGGPVATASPAITATGKSVAKSAGKSSRKSAAEVAGTGSQTDAGKSPGRSGSSSGPAQSSSSETGPAKAAGTAGRDGSPGKAAQRDPSGAQAVANAANGGKDDTAAKQSAAAPGKILPPPAPAAHVVIEKLTTASVVKGDSLWRISRNILGRGIRYTQIYAANTSQIRNPNLIYPGQVLVVPLGSPSGNPSGNAANSPNAPAGAAKP